MSLESILARELDICFIDARHLSNEAKINLGVRGYPNKEQVLQLREEALRLFEQLPRNLKDAKRQLRLDLEVAKMVIESSHSFTAPVEVAASETSSSDCCSDTDLFPRASSARTTSCTRGGSRGRDPLSLRVRRSPAA